MSAFHSRMSRVIVRRFSSVGSTSPSWMSRTCVVMPSSLARSCDFRRAATARSGPPASFQCPMSPLVTETNLT